MVKVGRHVFQPGDLLDWRGRPTCALCPLPKDNEIHEVPAVPKEVRDVEAARLGESQRE
jgi:hypothetical protein